MPRTQRSIKPRLTIAKTGMCKQSVGRAGAPLTYNDKRRVTEVCITEPLSCKNIFHTEGFIVSDNIMQYTPKILQTLLQPE